MKSKTGLKMAFACLLATTACGLDGLLGIEEPDERTDVAADKEPPAESWTWKSPECEATLKRNTTFSFGNGGRSQLAPSLAFDGQLYASWSQPPADETNSQFDVLARVVGCDLVAVSEALTLSADADLNHTSPRTVTTPDGALVAWHASGGADPFPATKIRILNRAGAAAGDELTLLPAEAAWMPDVALLPNGNVSVALVHGINDTPFRATFHELDGAGNIVGEEHATATTDHSNPAIATTATDIHLVWQRDLEFNKSHIETAPVSGSGVGATTNLTPARNANYPRASGWLGEGGRAWTVFSSTLEGGSTIVLRELGGSLQTALGVGGGSNIAPAVAASADGGAVAWLAQDSGARSLIAQRFRAGTAGLSTSVPLTVPTGEVYQSPPAIVHLSGDDFAVAWSEGKHPNAEVKLRIIELK